MPLCLMIQRVHLIIHTEEKIVEIFLRFFDVNHVFIFQRFDIEMKSIPSSFNVSRPERIDKIGEAAHYLVVTGSAVKGSLPKLKLATN